MSWCPSAPKCTAAYPHRARLRSASVPRGDGAGADVTAQYRKGAEIALQLARLTGCRVAVLKANSPSCGHGTIYDGTFSGKKFPAAGVAAELLEQNGITVYTDEDCAAALPSSDHESR